MIFLNIVLYINVKRLVYGIVNELDRMFCFLSLPIFFFYFAKLTIYKNDFEHSWRDILFVCLTHMSILFINLTHIYKHAINGEKKNNFYNIDIYELQNIQATIISIFFS